MSEATPNNSNDLGNNHSKSFLTDTIREIDLYKFTDQTSDLEDFLNNERLVNQEYKYHEEEFKNLAMTTIEIARMTSDLISQKLHRQSTN